MSTIVSIKQKILQLGAGSFQNLCDAYLYRTGYTETLVSFGSHSGTERTTKGTPDTYFRTSDGKYTFVEYTTQTDSVFNKIKKDIGKCLDEKRTGITHDKIAEIIYFHTSSNISPSQDNEVNTICKDAGIKFTIIGIDKLAEDLFFSHHILIRDNLGISISTNQIQTYDDFIKDYNSNKMAAPINTQFILRKEEIEDIDKAYQMTDVVILSGASGTGKTRLALYYAKKHSVELNEKLFCFHNNDLSIYEELRVYIDNPGNYFLLVDDANQLSELKQIIRYSNMKPDGFNVKIIITVRDYALQKVRKDLNEISSYKIVNIRAFTDNETKELLEVALGVKNSHYQERILRIAKGNARIAMLAGKLVCNSNSMESINDISQLYENYYGFLFEKNQLSIDNSILITAGLIAFLGVLHFEQIDSFLPILQDKGLCRDSFIENIHKLHEQEIVDIYNDKVIRISDQCLSNYVLKYIFFDKKLLSLSKVIKTCFNDYREKTILSINTLLDVFKNEELYIFVKNEVKIVWDELQKEKSIYFFEFVKSFFRVNSTKTLLILWEKIELENNVVIDFSNIDTEKGKNNILITDDIIDILSGFANMENFSAALDLFFQYYTKRPDLYMQFYHATNQSFSIEEDYEYNGFTTQITFFEKIKEYSDNWKKECFVILFLNLAKEFLKLFFSPSKMLKKHTITIYSIPLVISEGVKKYRRVIWDSLYELCGIHKYRNKVRDILDSYGGKIETISLPVLHFDLIYIKHIMEQYFPVDELRNCILAKSLKNVITQLDESYETLFTEYFEGEAYNQYYLLKGPDYEKTNLNDLPRLKRESITHYISNCSLEMFKQLIDVCNDIDYLDGHSSYRVGEGLAIAFDALSHKKDSYIDGIMYYIQKDTPKNLYPNKLISILFTFMTDIEVFKLITSYEYKQRNSWVYAFYCELPQVLINNKHVQNLYDFLYDKSDATLTSASPRDVNFLEKYKRIDDDVFIEGCRIILSKMNYSPFMVNIYFNLMFNINCTSPIGLIEKFKSQLDLLEEIYFAVLLFDANNDYDGKFLKEIYLAKPSILIKYINYLVNHNENIDNSKERNLCFFELSNFIEIYNIILDQYIKNCNYERNTLENYLESILFGKHNLFEKQDRWISQYIQLFNDDKNKMYYLFLVISKFQVDRKRKFVLFFINTNQSFDDFQEIPLTPISYGWTGSAIPLYLNWIEYLESLLPFLNGLKWIRHKEYVEKKISNLKREIGTEQINEILIG